MRLFSTPIWRISSSRSAHSNCRFFFRCKSPSCYSGLKIRFNNVTQGSLQDYCPWWHQGWEDAVGESFYGQLRTQASSSIVCCFLFVAVVMVLTFSSRASLVGTGLFEKTWCHCRCWYVNNTSCKRQGRIQPSGKFIISHDIKSQLSTLCRHIFRSGTHQEMQPRWSPWEKGTWQPMVACWCTACWWSARLSVWKKGWRPTGECRVVGTALLFQYYCW